MDGQPAASVCTVSRARRPTLGKRPGRAPLTKEHPMRRKWVGCVAALALALGVAAGLSYRARGAEAPFAGTWKVTAVAGTQQVTLCLLRVGDKDGKPEARVIWGYEQQFKDA